MKLNFVLFFLLFFITANCQLLTWSPDFIQENSTPVEIIVDATKGNQGLKDYTPTTDVYVHIGVITSFSTSSSDWRYSKFTWATTPAQAQATYSGTNKWKYTIAGGLRTFFGITNASEKILKIAILFRNGSGTRVQRNTDGSDMYIPVYDASLQVRLTNPPREPKYNPVAEPMTVYVGSTVPATAKSSGNATLKLYLNGTQFATAANTTTLSGNAVISSAGTQTIIAEATSGSLTKYDTIQFVATANTVVEPLPAGVKDGITYEAGDTSVTLVLFAPGKTNIAVIGEFNNWSPTAAYQMKKTPDGQRFWVRFTGLTPGVEYAYQYLIDGSLKVADYNTEKVLDPANDPFIPATNYPNLKAYPTGKTTGIVSVLQTAKPKYNWQVTNFTKADQRNLLIYELLVRDFVAAQNWQTLRDTLSYIKRLGINAIEVMPFNEFEGNNSWGYNPDFFFAPDKMYGTETALKQFIDECHKQGIAVIMDMVMNHAFGQSPTVQMYWNPALNRPSADNPWHNEVAKHPFNVGYDFNHESAATKDLVSRVIKHWLTNYKIDGFRWDLSKGFTQTNSCTTANCDQQSEVNNWGNYDASRIAIWKRYYDTMQATVANSYCILEHFAANNEETELSNYGMMLWGNANYNFNEATIGYLGNSNFQYGIYTNRGWTNPYLVTYQESHDEERLMYKNEQYGNASGTYNIKDVNTALKRNEMAASFWATIPGPKMMWQFEELGYDYSINTCEDGITISDACRLSRKPIRWDYQNNPNRKALYNVYSKLLKLRNVPNFLPTFVTNNITYNLSGGFKTLQVSSDSLKLTVIGNFDVVSATGTVTFQNAGTWYNYLNGGTRAATGAPETITLQPGEYYVYTNRDANPLVAALPLKLILFEGKRNANDISIVWKTTNEVNVKDFGLERSFNGKDFLNIYTKAASNAPSSQQLTYNYTDADPLAVKAADKIYYRLKMTDIDGKAAYSNIIAVNPAGYEGEVSVYPNPVKGSNLFIKVTKQNQQTIRVKIEDISGRVWKIYTFNTGNYSSGIIPVNVKQLPAGTYIIKTETIESSSVNRFIIQH